MRHNQNLPLRQLELGLVKIILPVLSQKRSPFTNLSHLID